MTSIPLSSAQALATALVYLLLPGGLYYGFGRLLALTGLPKDTVLVLAAAAPVLFLVLVVRRKGGGDD